MIYQWGPTQSLCKDINTMSIQQIQASLEYLDLLDKSGKFYNKKLLAERIKNLNEVKEFLSRGNENYERIDE
jgi:hypothetical protein